MTHVLRSSRALSPVARAGLLSLVAVCGAASAAEFGTVTAVTPATQQVRTPQRQCWQQQQLVQQPTTGGGAVTGAVIGGVLGHGLGGGGVGTAIGALIGAGVGNDVEASGTPPAAYTSTRCRDVAAVQQQSVYDVQYDYNGQHYSVKMANAPAVGSQIPLDVTASDALPPPAASDGNEPPQDGVTYVAPPATYVYPAYPAYQAYPYAYGYGYGYPYAYPAVRIGIAPRIWIGGGWGWHRWH
jgi:uncharacterized protein YcfJ